MVYIKFNSRELKAKLLATRRYLLPADMHFESKNHCYQGKYGLNALSPSYLYRVHLSHITLRLLKVSPQKGTDSNKSFLGTNFSIDPYSFS